MADLVELCDRVVLSEQYIFLTEAAEVLKTVRDVDLSWMM